MNRDKLRQENQALQRRFENKYYGYDRKEKDGSITFVPGPVVKAIQSKVDEVKSIIKKNGPHAAVAHLNNQLSNTKLIETVQKLSLEVGLQFARRTWNSLQDQRRNAKGFQVITLVQYNTMDTKGFGLNEQWIEWIKNYLFDFIVQKISFSVFETTKDVLFTVLNEAIREGWGIDQTVKALDELPLSKSQAARIVRTEITRAANAGAMAAGSTFPFLQQKEWISAHDTRVRGFDPKDHASHLGMDGQAVNYEDVFRDPRNGDELMFPGDPNASAESTVNCRCSAAVTAKLDENGRLIPKPKTTNVIYPSNRRRQIIAI